MSFICAGKTAGPRGRRCKNRVSATGLCHHHGKSDEMDRWGESELRLLKNASDVAPKAMSTIIRALASIEMKKRKSQEGSRREVGPGMEVINEHELHHERRNLQQANPGGPGQYVALAEQHLQHHEDQRLAQHEEEGHEQHEERHEEQRPAEKQQEPFVRPVNMRDNPLAGEDEDVPAVVNLEGYTLVSDRLVSLSEAFNRLCAEAADRESQRLHLLNELSRAGNAALALEVQLADTRTELAAARGDENGQREVVLNSGAVAVGDRTIQLKQVRILLNGLKIVKSDNNVKKKIVAK